MLSIDDDDGLVNASEVAITALVKSLFILSIIKDLTKRVNVINFSISSMKTGHPVCVDH